MVWERQYWQEVKNDGEMESRVAKVDAFVTSDFGKLETRRRVWYNRSACNKASQDGWENNERAKLPMEPSS